MSLIVEDGTGLANSNSYQSVADFKAYWATVGYDLTAYTDPQIEYGLLNAMRYMETRYGPLWFGYRTSDTQALSWPRSCVLDPLRPCVYLTGVPAQVAAAQNEYARRALSGVDALLPDPADTDATGQVIKRISKGVGPLKKDIEYASAGAVILQDFPAADMKLVGLLLDNSGCTR